MKAKKRNKWLIIPVLLIFVIISIVLYAIFNPNNLKNGVSLNLFEQRWIEDNKNEIVNVSIPSNIPILNIEGSGIAFSFLDYFEKETELEFNKIPYIIGETDPTGNSFQILRDNKKLKNNDLLFYTDDYAVVSKNPETKASLDNLEGKVGLLKDDFSSVTSYFDNNNLSFYKSNNIDELLMGFENNLYNYIVIPKHLYLNYIIESDYYILNTLNDLSLKYVLRLSDNDGRLNNIIKKYYTYWINNSLTSEYYSELLSLYTSVKAIDDKNNTDFKSKRYVYGYVDDAPYELFNNNELKGISSGFIDSFSTFSGVEFSYKKYNSVSELNKALEKGTIDIALNYYNLNSSNAYKTLDIALSNYVILSKDNSVIIDTIKALKDTTIYTIKNTKLSHYLKNNSNFNVKEVDNVSSLRNRELILIDYNVYSYYKNDYFQKYSIVYQASSNSNYNYLINKIDGNTLFYNIFNYYLSMANNDKIERIAIDELTSKSLNLDLSLLWLYVILLPVFAFVLILIFRKRKKIVKVRNDVKLKYIDPLTSLKNRYYLNNNINKWEENNIYPQAIVVININNLKDINDAYGYEGGDQLIKNAANILINNQMEKTDIIRTDGNEFVIYMVGYDESAVIAYVRKLYRLLKDLPYEYGASLGYSMIEDDIKTIEDAINEAILDMITNRDTKRNTDI
jgi:diguanylate cyclase (GGDEF)-like protein